MNDAVPAKLIDRPQDGPHTVLSRGPGSMWVIADRMAGERFDDRWQVCCPGCGTKVYSLPTHTYVVTLPDGREEIKPGYTLTGDITRAETLDMLEEVNFVPCGCGRWRLRNGWWRRQVSSVLLP